MTLKARDLFAATPTCPWCSNSLLSAAAPTLTFMLTTALTLFALAVASWSLYVMTRQLTVARSASGGRAMVFTAGITGQPEQPFRFEPPDDSGIRRPALVPEYRVRLTVGGPGVLHHVSVFLVDESTGGDYELPDRPETRITMGAADDPIEWTFTIPAEVAANAWVVATWREPHLEGVKSQAIARWLTGNDIYWLHMYSAWSRWVRTRIRNWARKNPRLSWESLRDMRIYGKWKRRTPTNPLDIQGTIGAPPRTER